VKGLSPDELKSLLLSVGSHHKERMLSPVEVGLLIGKATSAGETRQSIAEQLQIGGTQVSEFLRLTDLTTEVRDLADWGGRTGSTIAFSSLAQLARLSAEDQMAAAMAILENMLTWKEVVQLVQLRSRSGRSISDCVEAVLKMRPTVERRHVYLGRIESGPLRSQLVRRSQRERDELLASVIEKILAGRSIEVAGRLGAEIFSLSSRADVPSQLGVTADELEAHIVRELQSEADAS
jgi:hypothetical protein